VLRFCCRIFDISFRYPDGSEDPIHLIPKTRRAGAVPRGAGSRRPFRR
jgi:hypothetical protein